MVSEQHWQVDNNAQQDKLCSHANCLLCNFATNFQLDKEGVGLFLRGSNVQEDMEVKSNYFPSDNKMI